MLLPSPYLSEPRMPPQIKHLILGRYLRSWGSIICGKNRSVNLAFVDTCAGAGSYFDIKGIKEPIGSPLIALRTLSELKATPSYFLGKDNRDKIPFC